MKALRWGGSSSRWGLGLVVIAGCGAGALAPLSDFSSYTPAEAMGPAVTTRSIRS